MRSYKKLSGLVLGAMLLGTVLPTCKDEFLDVTARGQLAPEVLATKAGVEGVVLGAYAQLAGRGNYFGGASNWATFRVVRQTKEPKMATFPPLTTWFVTNSILPTAFPMIAGADSSKELPERMQP